MNQKIQEIIGLMKNTTEESEKLVTEAFEFASIIHSDHRRHSGEPSINHLVETAKIIAELGMDADSVAAGLLHDALENGALESEIEQKFGKDILFLVQAVTVLGTIQYRSDTVHMESLRKFFVAMAQDLRVLIIKLSSRLHNMRTLEHVPRPRQIRTANQTVDIYAPLAYRLGVRKMSRELEDLAFPYIAPEAFDETRELMRKKSIENESQLAKFRKVLAKTLAKSGVQNFRTEYRVKGLYSLYKKLQRKEKDINKIYDIMAIRVIVPEIADCYQILGIVHGQWRPLPGRIKDYIAFPKPNGYRSLHTTVFTGDGGLVEVQIKTESMHRESEYGIASHISYKEGFAQKAINPNLIWVKKLLPYRSRLYAPISLPKNVERYKIPPLWIKELADYQKNTFSERGIAESLQTDFFGERIFVFTPKGDVVDLPVESSPVDFAYAIHSDIGNHMTGAKVNGKLVSYDSKLKNGDIVEIITKESGHPSRKWLDASKTTLAQRHIKAALHREYNKDIVPEKTVSHKRTKPAAASKSVGGRRLRPIR